MNKENWYNSDVQFPRLLTEIYGLIDEGEQEGFDFYEALSASMDLGVEEIQDLFERARNIHEIHKVEHCGAVELEIACPKCEHPHLNNPIFIDSESAYILDCDNCEDTCKIDANGIFVANPDNDEVECSSCHKIVDRDDAFKDKKKDELVCTTCLARMIAIDALDS